ncbi:MAG: phosphoserine phosphatase SerB [Rhodobacterales bacterium]
MYVATLIANPEQANLTSAMAIQTAIKLGVQGMVWLAENVACDIEMTNRPDNTDAVWQELQKQEIDFVIQPIDGRRKKILLADMDSTMIRQECIDELAAEAGVGAHVSAITVRAMNGEMDFNDALVERVGLMKGLDSAVIQKVLDTRISLMPGGDILLATMKVNGAYAALVSGGFTDFTQAIATKLGFDENRANTLLHENGKLTGKVKMPILGREAKVEALHDLTQKRGLTSKDVIAVGDGANDLGMLTLAGTGVALHAKPKVAAECDMRLNFADLTGLLYLQGYKQSDLVFPKAVSES